MKIEVVDKNSAWFDVYDITVQILDDNGDLLECNHAGAELEEVDYGGLRHDSVGDLDWFDDIHKALVCDKCEHVEDIEPDEPDYDRDEY